MERYPLFLSLLLLAEVKLSRSIISGEGTQNLPTKDEMSSLPFLQSMPYRLFLRACRASEDWKRLQHEKVVAEEEDLTTYLILNTVNREPNPDWRVIHLVVADERCPGCRVYVRDVFDSLVGRREIEEVVEGELELTYQGMKTLMRMVGERRTSMHESIHESLQSTRS